MGEIQNKPTAIVKLNIPDVERQGAGADAAAWLGVRGLFQCDRGGTYGNAGPFANALVVVGVLLESDSAASVQREAG